MITIITVVYNAEKTIGRTVESVCTQSLLPSEYIIIDGKSTDKTLQIVNNYKEKYDFITVISEKDNGIYDAMNKGLSISNGAIIGIINSDDWYDSNCLKYIDTEYNKYGSGVYYGIQRKFRNNQEFSLDRHSHNFLNTGMIPHPTVFITRDIYKSIGDFDTSKRFVADYALMVKIKNAGFKFYPIDKVLSNFSIGGASATYLATLESLKFKYEQGFINKKSYYFKRFKVLVVNKYLGR